ASAERGGLTGERAGHRDRRRRCDVCGLDGLHRTRRLQAGERGIERAEGDARERSEDLPQALLQLVAMELGLLEDPEDGQLDHIDRYIGPIYQTQTSRGP